MSLAVEQQMRRGLRRRRRFEVCPGVALACARNLHAATDRREEVASRLAFWVVTNTTDFDLDLPDTDPIDLHGKAVRADVWHGIGAALAAAERETPVGGDAMLWATRLAARLGFDEAEHALLAFLLAYRLDAQAESFFDAIAATCGGPRVVAGDLRILARLLGVQPGLLAKRLLPEGALFRSGLLDADGDGIVKVASPLLRQAGRGAPPAGDVFDPLLCAPATAELGWDAFDHLGPQTMIAAEMLRAALAGGETGINVLLYGPPGTGKTSFAATLAARIGATLRPVSEADERGETPTAFERLAGLRLAQRLVAGTGQVLLFDEAEDLFGRNDRIQNETPISRAYFHRLMERTPVPVIWTANDISLLGSAVLRRMTICLEARIPGPRARTALWRAIAAGEGVALEEAEAARLARLLPTAPALVASSLRAARLAGGGAETACLVVEGIARAVSGHIATPQGQEAAYDSALVNADADLDALEAALLRPNAPRAVSFLLSGPPGTGKTAWARHIARRMGLEVLQKRASDLLDPFVGGTERLIADAFAEARQEGTFLVFDEADSLLAERADAVRTWEVSQVNEMLTWMESHPLPFACTTNLPDRLDRASLRRFLVKLRLGWLTATQARRAFRQILGAEPPLGIEALRTLTPADFALVRRRAALLGTDDPERLLDLLAAECVGREGGRGPLGFAPETRTRVEA